MALPLGHFSEVHFLGNGIDEHGHETFLISLLMPDIKRGQGQGGEERPEPEMIFREKTEE